MPDLITHTSLAWIIHRTAGSIARRNTGTAALSLFLLGTILPDILTRPFYILWPATHDWTAPFHTPVGAVLACLFLSLFFVPEQRKQVRFQLISGALFHFLLDAMQKQVIGNNFWLFPISWHNFGFGMFWAGDILLLTPLFLSLVLITEWVFRMGIRRKRNKNGFESGAHKKETA